MNKSQFLIGRSGKSCSMNWSVPLKLKAGGADIQEVLRSTSPRFNVGQDSPSSESKHPTIIPSVTYEIFCKTIEAGMYCSFAVLINHELLSRNIFLTCFILVGQLVRWQAGMGRSVGWIPSKISSLESSRRLSMNLTRCQGYEIDL